MTEQQAIEICNTIATTDKGLLRVCTDMKVSSRTFYEWVQADPENEKRYVRAREEQAELLADQIIEIADDSSRDTKVITKGGEQIEVEDTEWTNRSKLRVEARKWTAAKLRPKKYGDKLDVTTDGEKITNVTVEVKNTGIPLANSESEVKA